MAKPCTSCLTRPRRYACLRCGDALCRRCVGRNACGCWVLVSDGRDVKPPDILHPNDLDDVDGDLSQLSPPVASRQTSSAVPPPEPARAAETPAPSTTPRLPADAGGGRASSPRLTVREFALRMLETQPTITALQVARESGRDYDTCKTTLWGLRKTGVLRYWPVAKAEQRRGVSGTYSLPDAAPPPRSDLEASQQRPPPALRRVPSASAVTTPASAVALHPRARGPVAGQHATASAFFADTPPLPKARPPRCLERGGA